MREYLIYKATSPSGKVYIGVTSKTLDIRSVQHKRAAKSNVGCPHYFWHALQKYGEAIQWDVLEEGIQGPEAASDAEKRFIKQYQSDDAKYGYNLTSGGLFSTCITSAETRRRMSEAAKNRGVTPRQKENLELGWALARDPDVQRQRSLKSSKMTGKHHSDLTIQQMSEAHKGKVFTDDHKRKIGASQRHTPVLRSDGSLFPSIASAIRAMGGKGHIDRVLGTGKLTMGFGFSRLSEEEYQTRMGSVDSLSVPVCEDAR